MTKPKSMLKKPQVIIPIIPIPSNIVVHSIIFTQRYRNEGAGARCPCSFAPSSWGFLWVLQSRARTPSSCCTDPSSSSCASCLPDSSHLLLPSSCLASFRAFRSVIFLLWLLGYSQVAPRAKSKTPLITTFFISVLLLDETVFSQLI